MDDLFRIELKIQAALHDTQIDSSQAVWYSQVKEKRYLYQCGFCISPQSRWNIRMSCILVASNMMDRRNTFRDKIKEYGSECQFDSGFEYFDVRNLNKILEWATINGYVMHGTTKQIPEELIPKKANDSKKESGNREAVYMTNNPLLAEFTALTGGKNVGGRQNRCFMTINKGRVCYPQEPEFSVGKPEAVAAEGYIYVLDKATQVDEEVSGEYLAYRPIKPLAVIRMKCEDFKYPIKKTLFDL
jgi:hypothetical protein